MLHSVSHGANDLPWIRRMSAPVLVNKNILVDKSRHCNIRLWRANSKKAAATSAGAKGMIVVGGQGMV